MITKKCASCNEVKTSENFYKNSQLKSGLHSYCKTCMRIKNQENGYALKAARIRNKRKKEDPKYRKQVNKLKRESRARNYKTVLFKSAQIRANKKGIEFSIIKKDIIIPEICPILKKPLKVGNKNNYSFSPSLDRLDNTKGYTKDNTIVISIKANRIKNSATLQELKLFANWINETIN
jgi:hypothetical protein